MTIESAAAARLHVSAAGIVIALSNALAQRPPSTIYTQRNQYSLILETLPWLQRDPHFLDHVYIGADTGLPVPLGSVAHLTYGIVALNAEHDTQRVTAR
jgi:multidrug efflux pump subunit AcrB